jgi:uncharacterized integral membrane protein
MAGLVPAINVFRIAARTRRQREIDMFRKIVTAIIVVPLVVILVAFAVANRQAVTVSFDPLSATSPAYAATLPLFILIFVVLIVGVLIGGFAAWLRQGKWRRAARRLDADVRAVRDEIAALRRHPAPPPEPNPPAAIPPPVL